MSANALLSTIMGYKNTKSTKAMKHGLSLEPVAKKSYVDKMKKSHKKFNATDSGLTLHNLKPFVGASADLEISCDCCGIGLCEIKCPETIKNESPTEDNLAYVKNGKVNENHQYFYQIQGQMGVLQRGYCDLFIFTFHGNMTVRVPFQEEFWSTVFNKVIAGFGQTSSSLKYWNPL